MILGSSPLTRGKPSYKASERSGNRLIPAHAGKTRNESAQLTKVRAHPRSRGENDFDTWMDNVVDGSSPLTRGKRKQSTRSSTGLRLIPAHAGKTRIISHLPSWPEAHPRSRGENRQHASRTVVFWGSSPLTRGKLHNARTALRGHGLIPAHAGKTWAAERPALKTTAHPRSRGENPLRCGPHARYRGSSPLTRGKPAVRSFIESTPGLIPAHAGKTLSKLARSSPPTAHPRSRGENATREYASACQLGSSPLTRGKREFNCARSGDGGLIPAHAGKTTWSVARRGSRGAHPRSRGENLNLVMIDEAWAGSSPLTRGKR